MRKLLLAAMLTGISLGAAAQGQVNIICSVQAEWCNLMSTVYSRTTPAGCEAGPGRGGDR
jgi:iron(III) transport system substrate-binding protein